MSSSYSSLSASYVLVPSRSLLLFESSEMTEARLLMEGGAGKG